MLVDRKTYKKQGQANANWFKCEYGVFFDTSGNLRLERVNLRRMSEYLQVFKPQQKEKKA